MSSVGALMKRKTPSLYNFLTGKLLQMKRYFRPYQIYITDDLGGSFKSYFDKEDMSIKLSKLKHGLDESSLQVVDTIYERQRCYPDAKNKVKTSKSAAIIGGILPVEKASNRKLIDLSLDKWANKTPYKKAQIESSVFHYFHGLTEVPESVTKYISGQDFMDLGAFIGDSAIALTEYNYGKIYSVEMSLKSIEAYQSNLQVYGVSKDKYQVINAGISAEDGLSNLEIPDTGSSGLSLLRDQGKYDVISVERKTLDKIVEENNIKPKFIKVDIEGFGLDFIKGGKESLKKHRPVISLAIYHNPYEFYEAKPMLEEILDAYEYRICKLTEGIQNNLCHSEVILMAYPKEALA